MRVVAHDISIANGGDMISIYGIWKFKLISVYRGQPGVSFFSKLHVAFSHNEVYENFLRTSMEPQANIEFLRKPLFYE